MASGLLRDCRRGAAEHAEYDSLKEWHGLADPKNYVPRLAARSRSGKRTARERARMADAGGFRHLQPELSKQVQTHEGFTETSDYAG